MATPQPDLQRLLQAAIAQHLLPAGTAAPAVEPGRAWPVVLLTALGAWLAALPLLAVVGLLLGDLVTRSGGPYLIGVLVLLAALVPLRSRELPLFVEQLAVPGLLVGAGSLGFGLFRDLDDRVAAAVLALLALGIGLVVRAAWLRVLLGAAAAAVCALALTRGFGADVWRAWRMDWWWPMHLTLLVWLAAHAALRTGASTRTARAAQSLATGWLLAVLAALALRTGMGFLVGAGVGASVAGEIAGSLRPRDPTGKLLAIEPALSAALALAGALLAGHAWPGLRRPWLVPVALVLVALAWFMPTLGAVLLVLALCTTASRWLLAGAAALAAAWIVGAFYYQLHWPLGTKALVLAAAGALLGALAWRGLAERTDEAAPTAHAGAPAHAADAEVARAAPVLGAQGAAAVRAFTRWGLAASLVLVLAGANVGIWQKERLIAQGQPVFVELAPVDPRSLMQGDFMRLNFRLPVAVSDGSSVGIGARRPHLVVRRDARGIATPLRLDNGQPLAADELRIELTPKAGRWILVSDAWFFAEGEGERWARAKYAEFRVEPGGRALLVGLRGPALEAL